MAARFLGRLGPVVIALGLVSLLNDVASEMIIPLLPGGGGRRPFRERRTGPG